MKILLATVYDYPHLGGLSVHLTTLKAGLESRGHEVDVVSFTDVPKWKRDGIVRGPAFLLNKMKQGKGYVWTLKRRQDELASLIKEAVSKKEYDIINAQDVFTTFAALETNVPVVSTVHGYLTFEGISKGTVIEGSPEAAELQEAERRGYKSTREVITVDTRIKEYILKETGVTGHMIKNFIDVESFKPEIERRTEFRDTYGFSQDELIFFVPRRLTKKNGVMYPILSLPAVVEKFPNARVVFAGTGEMMEPMKQKAAELGVSDHITMLGAVDHSVMMQYYALANVALVPSIYSAGVEEATSISALEAMGSGVPLIACAVGGLKEIVDSGKDGLLVEEQNPEQLSDAMIRLLEDPAYGEQLAKAGRAKIIEEYSHFAAAEKYEAIYLKALKH
ncbi:glycosyltransferase family 4 protein [Sporosarcina gallistercoris]|uniref:Glycosyltransferase family 4 protein n=1 Tax=Sporosarcina gallistercoris TaxID=2762245 RepID=A0ABR8PLQ9_9BACL|nr:glycosyltransferase family 4 protein [Sporosarcina gallistercoris]MBD7909122.1 glycosyltransferase family 4 protein [Sporosarcina gallistercoris]